MKILQVQSLAIPEVKVIRYQRFVDNRGYFTEAFNVKENSENTELQFLKNKTFVQTNESYSKKGTVRGLHIQWTPYQGKLVRTTIGKMTDLIVDLRIGSPTFSKIIAYEMPSAEDKEYGELIWIPIGFGHGNFYTQDSKIEYYCTDMWNPKAETGVSPLAADLDWSLCDPNLKSQFDAMIQNSPLMSDKDKDGLTIAQWSAHAAATEHFTFASLQSSQG